MSSSMLAGERRWASARRGGMTVLGKVSVPKPLNLPSQRLENHGLDPNVEIVPKGTLSWGNRSSSSASNAWSSSIQSPTADGGTSSPSHLSARPSSSGSCTRPSTAGSDRTHEPTASAWTSNSRPSSASGTLASSQTSSTSLRPRSAETRPNSSQLSRFAEPVSESLVAWGPSSAAERLGVKSAKEDGFSLSSGDFPTLGSDRNDGVKNIELQDHGSHDHPRSASSRASGVDEKTTMSQDVADSEPINTWKRDGIRTAEDGIHPSREKWQGDPQQYYHSNVPPPHFDSWRGPPMNAPPGVWYRGPSGRPSFGAPVGPGGFPMEPFPYHRPQVVPVPLAGSQQVPPPGNGPRGPSPKNGDLYRTPMPDAYSRPAMPFRPGFYPGPMPFDNYYGPPMGYRNANDREIPYMGMAAGPPVFNRFPVPGAPEPTYSHGRADGRGSTGKTWLGKVEADHLEGNQGSFSIPLKNQKERDRMEEEENWESILPSSASQRGKDGLPVVSSRKTEWGADDDMEEDIFAKQTTPHEDASLNYEGHSSTTLKVMSLKDTGNVKALDENWIKKTEYYPPELLHQTPASERESTLPSTTKGSGLMQKIEGLNVKVRASDGRYDVQSTYNREKKRSGYQVAEAKINNSAVEANSNAESFERTSASADFVPVPREVIVPVGDKSSQPTAFVSRRTYHGGQGNFRGKGKFNSQDDDGMQKKFDVISTSNVEYSSDIHACGTDDNLNSGIYLVKDGGQSSAESYDSTDIQAQRAKMRETAKQRALQLQMEEEERTREQKAKALAKLEELNRRAQAVETGLQNTERTKGVGVIQGEQEESRALAGEVTADFKFQAPGPTQGSDSGAVSQHTDSAASHAGESANTSRDSHLETHPPSDLDHVLHHHSSPSKQDFHSAGTTIAFRSDDSKQDFHSAGTTIAFRSDDGSGFRHKRTGYKQKHNDPSQKNLNERSALNVTGAASKDLTDASVHDVIQAEVTSSVRAIDETNAPDTSDILADPSIQQRRKGNRNGKNKQRLDEAVVIPPTAPLTLEETNPTKESIEKGKSKALSSDLGGSDLPKIEPDGGEHTSEVHLSLHDEDAHGRISKQWKPQSRRMPRSALANRVGDKYHSIDTVIWAPVRSQSKVEAVVEASQKSSAEASTPAKIDNLVQNNAKSKRAEMERYVPKPVAKELAQQGNIQPGSSTIPAPEEAAGKAQSQSTRSPSPLSNSSATGILEPGIDVKEGDGRPNKQGKAQGTWRQRNLAEPSNRKNVHQGPSATSISNPSKDIHRSTDQNQFVKHGVNASKSEPNISSENSTIYSSNMSLDIESAAAGKSFAVKDQLATGRGKRHPSKGNKSMGNNYDPELRNIVSSESAAADVNQIDRTISSKEGHSSGERTQSHWQPKSHTNSENNQNRGRLAGSETVSVEIDKAPKRDHRPQHKVHVPLHPDSNVREGNMANDPNVSHCEESVREKKPVPLKDVGHHQESIRERKPAPPVKGRPYLPSQVPPPGVGESAASNAAAEQEGNFSSAFRRNGNQNSRSGRGHESHGDWSSGHDSRQHSVPAFRERQRQNVHYEYQPVGHYKNSKMDKHMESGDGSTDGAPRYRERNQNHLKRDGGNFHRRQGGPAWVDSAHK